MKTLIYKIGVMVEYPKYFKYFIGSLWDKVDWLVYMLFFGLVYFCLMCWLIYICK